MKSGRREKNVSGSGRHKVAARVALMLEEYKARRAGRRAKIREASNEKPA